MMSIEKPVGRAPKSRATGLTRSIQLEIERGGYKPGSRLPGESALAARLGVSRPMIREALQTLKARGVVESRRGSGSYLSAEPGLRGMSEMMEAYSSLVSEAPGYFELFDLRLMVEKFCVRRLAGMQCSADRLKEPLRRMEAAVDDLRKFGEADIKFHLAMVELTGHRLFYRIMKGLMDDLGRRFAKETYTDHSLVRQNLADHRAIHRLIASGNAEGAEARLARHLIKSREHLEAMLMAKRS